MEKPTTVYVTRGHELRGETAGGKAYTRQREQRENKWDNCNSIINKIYLKKKTKTLLLSFIKKMQAIIIIYFILVFTHKNFSHKEKSISLDNIKIVSI